MASRNEREQKKGFVALTLATTLFHVVLSSPFTDLSSVSSCGVCWKDENQKCGAAFAAISIFIQTWFKMW
jgi:hypothetical protein